MSGDEDFVIDDFKLLKLLGSGSFAKVYLAKCAKITGICPSEEKLYAIKAIRKDKLISSATVENAHIEKEIMLRTDHPFLIKMYGVFQSKVRIYFAMPYVPSEELYVVFKRQKRFNEHMVKFFAIQLILAIGELH